ncbi:MAG: hypothetical protein GF330_09930 [Candidatus Eisenbacteria bacterium]|nr:hypothetical protein [Candidatus Eisenbacteria bacterium]
MKPGGMRPLAAWRAIDSVAANRDPAASPMTLILLFLGLLCVAGCRDEVSRMRVETDLGGVLHTPVREVIGERPAEIRVRVEDPAPWALGALRLVYETPTGTVTLPLKPDRADAEPGWWRERIPHLGRGQTTRYYLELRSVGGVSWALPAGAPEQRISLTFKGGVSSPVLTGHVLCMMVGLGVLILAGLFAIAHLRTTRFLAPMRRCALIGVVLLAIGTLPLGMIVEYQVFGTYWEGWPFGRDVTDTKSGLMMVLWLILMLARGRALLSRLPARRGPSDRAWARWLIALVLFTIGLYLIPHENIKF